MSVRSIDPNSTSLRRSSRRWALACVLVSGALVIGCSSGSSTSTTASTAGSSTGSTPGTTAASTPPGSTTGTDAPGTTVAPSPAAKAATLTVADLGQDWRLYPADAKVYGDPTSTACSQPGGPVSRLAKSSISESGILQMGDRTRFVESTAWVFPDVAAAEEHLRYRLSPEFVECRRAQLEAGIAQADPKQHIVLLENTPAPPGSIEHRGTTFFATQIDVDGTRQQIGGSGHLTFLKGTTVIDLFAQSAPQQGDPAGLDARMDTEVDAAMNRVLERVPAT